VLSARDRNNPSREALSRAGALPSFSGGGLPPG
jgi:hypothetical protein